MLLSQKRQELHANVVAAEQENMQLRQLLFGLITSLSIERINNPQLDNIIEVYLRQLKGLRLEIDFDSAELLDRIVRAIEATEPSFTSSEVVFA